MLDASRDEIGFQLDGVGLKAVPPPPYTSVQSRLVNGAVMRKSKDTISEEAIRGELSRILESSIFVQSDRLGRSSVHCGDNIGRRRGHAEGVRDRHGGVRPLDFLSPQ
jgi:hypothetical protein